MNTSNEARQSDPRHHFNKKDLCQRCLTGIDDDHDGDCAFCHKLMNAEAANMRKIVLQMTIHDLEARQ